MDLGTWILFGVVAILVVNRFMVQLPGWAHRRLLFWSVQVVNLAAACFLIVVGIPGVTGPARYVSWIVALLFMFHIVQNNSRLVAARAEDAEDDRDDAEAERNRIKAALQAGQADESDPAAGAR